MTNETDESERQTPRHKDTRQDRLKSALRENLKRRKLQARERNKVTAGSGNDHEACPDGELGKGDH